VLRLLGAETAIELAGRVSTARELARRRAERHRDAFATGLAPLDRLLDGGLPRGALVELVGRSGSGRFAAVLATLATATTAGEAAVLVDLGDHLDPQAAAGLGLDAARLLWLRPQRVQQALAAAEAVLNGGFPLVVVDLGTPPVPGGRGNEAAWVRLARAAQTHGAALLVASPYRVSGTAAQAVVEARPERAVYVPGERASTPLLAGIGIRFTLEKDRGRQGGDEERAELVLPGAALPAARAGNGGAAAVAGRQDGQRDDRRDDRRDGAVKPARPARRRGARRPRPLPAPPPGAHTEIAAFDAVS